MQKFLRSVLGKVRFGNLFRPTTTGNRRLPTVPQSQRDCIIQPKVARRELPWVRYKKRGSTPTGLDQPRTNHRCYNPFGVVDFVVGSPKVARSSQPWANRWNPVGIQRKCFQKIFLLGATMLLCVSFAGQILATESADTNRWENEIQQFEAADKTNPPPQKAILFIGSSSIRLWKTLAKDFPEYKVINRGFGGSYLSDSVYFFDRIVKPYQPKMIVMYAGGNDINAGKTPEEVFGAFTNFVAKTRKVLPRTRIAYLSIAPNPARWSQVEQVKAANQLIENYTKKNSRLAFINVFPAMLGEDGKPKPDIFLSDNLHMNPKGYAIWVSMVRSSLKEHDRRK